LYLHLVLLLKQVHTLWILVLDLQLGGMDKEMCLLRQRILKVRLGSIII
jgi:hypothetical protein